MAYDNVNLWFAKDRNENIVTIDEINEENKHNKYYCPMCGSDLIPKAIKDDAKVTSHFAHVDKSKCNSEGMLHFWFKNKFIIPGDKFIVKTETSKEYVCKEILVEETYKTEYGDYRPDLTILTECGETIYFEMNYSNKKKLEDYLDKWLELGSVVVEVDIKTLMNSSMTNNYEFKSLFYNGKCFNTKKNDLYYNTIGIYKERLYKNNDYNEEIKERIKNLDWFWKDVNRYKKRDVDIDYMVELIDIIDEKDKEVIEEILNKPKCNDLLEEYLSKKVDTIYKTISNYAQNQLGTDYERYITKRIGYDYYNKRKTGEIHILDTSDNYFCVYDVIRHKKEYIIKECVHYIQKAIAYNENRNIINSYNNNAKMIEEEILKNNSFQDYIVNLTNKNPNYNININVKKINSNPEYFIKNNHNLNRFNVQIELIYNKYYNNIAEDYFKEIEINNNINQLCNAAVDKFNNYFSNLLYLNNINELENLINELQTVYLDCNVKISRNIILEDICEISVFMNNRHLESYYISNKGILSRMGIMTVHRGNEMLLETNDICKIKTYLIREINNKIKEEITFKCIDCEEKFTLEIGEIKFFNKKGFNYPRRCKQCRELRRNNK